MEITNIIDALKKLIAAAKNKSLPGKILPKKAFWDSDTEMWESPANDNTYTPGSRIVIAQIGDTIIVMDDPDGRPMGITITGPAAQVKTIKSLWTRLWDDENDDSNDN